MPFDSGRVSFCRFLVVNHSNEPTPALVDDALLAKLSEHSFAEAALTTPGQVEAGWVTGDHLLDIQFSHEKNAYGAPANLAMFALRIDTNRVPPEVKRAYRRINEQAMAAQNPSGFTSRAQRKDARDQADRQVHEDLASGKYRQSKMIPVLWDLAHHTVYCAAASNAVVEQLLRVFRETFAMELTPVTPGTLAGAILRGKGKKRDLEDLRPTAFTPAPAEATAEEENDRHRDAAIPAVPWSRMSGGGADTKDFLGNEFFLWLWWQAESSEGLVPVGHNGTAHEVSVVIDKTMELECAWGVRGKMGLRSGQIGVTRMSEAAEGLRAGKWPRKAGLILADREHQWELTLQTDKLIVTAAALPEVAEADTPREMIEQRLDLTRRLTATLDSLYEAFLAQRINGKWDGVRTSIRQWITSRGKGRPVVVTNPAGVDAALNREVEHPAAE